MATVALTAVQLATNTASADTADADGVTATSTTDGWTLTLPAGATAEKCVFRFLDDGSGATITFYDGTNPPSAQAALGDATFTLAASDVKFFTPSTRFQQTGGVIQCASSDSGTKCTVFILPVGVGGGSAVA